MSNNGSENDQQLAPEDDVQNSEDEDEENSDQERIGETDNESQSPLSDEERTNATENAADSHTLPSTVAAMKGNMRAANFEPQPPQESNPKHQYDSLRAMWPSSQVGGEQSQEQMPCKRTKKGDDHTPSAFANVQQCKALVRFATNETPRSGIDISHSACSPTAICTQDACVRGISFGDGYRAVPGELSQLRFTRTEDLAKAINFLCDPKFSKAEKVFKLSSTFHKISATATKPDYAFAASAFVFACSHRNQFLLNSVGYPLFFGKKGDIAYRDAHIEALEEVRTSLSMSKGCVDSPIIAIGGQPASKFSEATQDCIWIPVGDVNPQTKLQFPGWNDVLQLWEVSHRTQYVFVFLEHNVTETYISGLYKLSFSLHGVSFFVIAPLILPGTAEAVLQLRPKFVRWQKLYHSEKFKLCGWRDGIHEKSLIYEMEPRKGQRPILVNSTGALTGFAAHRMIVFFQTEYQANIQPANRQPPNEPANQLTQLQPTANRYSGCNDPPPAQKQKPWNSQQKRRHYQQEAGFCRGQQAPFKKYNAPIFQKRHCN